MTIFLSYFWFNIKIFLKYFVFVVVNNCVRSQRLFVSLFRRICFSTTVYVIVPIHYLLYLSLPLCKSTNIFIFRMPYLLMLYLEYIILDPCYYVVYNTFDVLCLWFLSYLFFVFGFFEKTPKKFFPRMFQIFWDFLALCTFRNQFSLEQPLYWNIFWNFLL